MMCTSPGRSAGKCSGAMPLVAGDGEIQQRLLDRLVGEAERAPVMAERLGRAAQLQRLHGLVRVHVVVAHEPARLVGADRQQRQRELGMAVAHAGKVAPSPKPVSPTQ